jgi:hypothetical protein
VISMASWSEPSDRPPLSFTRNDRIDAIPGLLVRFSTPIVAGDKNKTALSVATYFIHIVGIVIHIIGSAWLQNDSAYVGTEVWSCQSRGFLLRPL